MKSYENLSSIMKIVIKSEEGWPIYQGIASKIFSMLKLLVQAIASNLNVQSQANRKKITCNVCAGLNLYPEMPIKSGYYNTINQRLVFVR